MPSFQRRKRLGPGFRLRVGFLAFAPRAGLFAWLVRILCTNQGLVLLCFLGGPVGVVTLLQGAWIVDVYSCRLLRIGLVLGTIRVRGGRLNSFTSPRSARGHWRSTEDVFRGC